MAFPQGIDFRNTSGYVSDPTNCDYEIGSTNNYPRTTAQGNTVGWESGAAFSLNRRNRNSGIDARLAGLHFLSGLSGNVYRIDLPSAGSYDVRIAAGDASYANNCAWDLQDTSTLLTSLTTGATTAGGRWKDATNTQYTAANWVSSNTPYAATFSTTIMRVVSTNNSASISHLYVSAAAGGATYTLTCAAGSYAIAGQAATLAATHNYALACAAGAYTYTGKAATLTYTPGATTVDYTLTCVAGAYAISGQAANLTYARSMVAAAGAYAISGQAATLTVARNLSLATGAYVISGKNAVLTYTGAASYTLTCDAGAYSISGGAATLLWSGVVPSTAGGAQTGSGGGARAGTGRELRRLIDQIFEKKAEPAAVAKAILTVTPELTQLRDAIEVLELRAVKAPTSPKVTELLKKLKIAEQEADDEEQVVALLLLS